LLGVHDAAPVLPPLGADGVCSVARALLNVSATKEPRRSASVNHKCAHSDGGQNNGN
jgi:hypothetical protein